MKKFILLALAAFMVWSCSGQKQDNQTEPSQSQSSSSMNNTQSIPGTMDQVAGIQWQVPAGWERQGQRTMRVATYTIPAAAGDTSDAECVFYFGQGQGGDVDANINRWIAQVEQPDGSPSQDVAKRSDLESECCKIALVEIPGTYKSGGMGMAPQVSHPGWIVLGAVVAAPEGNVFFKVYGPAGTVNSLHDNFTQMLKTIKAGVDS
jgi:hypothetical protein